MWCLINSCSNHHNCICGHEKTNTVSLFLYIAQLACRQCSVAMRICTTLASKLCLAYVPAPSTYDLQVGFVCVFFSPISEISHQLLSPATKVLSDRDVLKPYVFWCLQLGWLGVIKKSQSQRLLGLPGLFTCILLPGAGGGGHLQTEHISLP